MPMKKTSIFNNGVFDNRKHLKLIVKGVICELIISGNSYVDQSRLVKAINQYFVDNEIEIDKLCLAEKINGIFLSLYRSHIIVPDVFYGNGYIINDNCLQTEKSLDEFMLRNNTMFRVPVQSFSGYYGCPMLYSREQAKNTINSFQSKTRTLVKNFASNYHDNFMDIREVFAL